MNTTYAQRQTTAQKKDATTAASVLDNSSQSESLQRKADMANSTAQRVETPRPNNTGMPDNLKAGIESLSGFSMDDVRVHYNSSKPATVQALAYTQGTDIHVAPGQEKHLPHEAWHVAQQMAGRVSPTTNINGMPVNDNAALEHEADVMGEKAVTQKKEACDNENKTISSNNGNVCQMLRIINGYTTLGNPGRVGDDLEYVAYGVDKLKQKYSYRLQEIIYTYKSATDQYKQSLLDCGIDGSIIVTIFQSYETKGLEPTIQDFTDFLRPRNLLDSVINELLQSTRQYCTLFEHFKRELFAYFSNGLAQQAYFRNLCVDIINGIDIGGKVAELDIILWRSFYKLDVVGETESIVVLAHGGDAGGTYAGVVPEVLAQQISRFLPDGYRGEIYLAGCETAVGLFPYIQGVRLWLQMIRPGLGNFSVKGTMSSSRIAHDTETHVPYVGVEGYPDNRGHRKEGKMHI